MSLLHVFHKMTLLVCLKRKPFHTKNVINVFSLSFTCGYNRCSCPRQTNSIFKYLCSATVPLRRRMRRRRCRSQLFRQDFFLFREKNQSQNVSCFLGNLQNLSAISYHLTECEWFLITKVLHIAEKIKSRKERPETVSWHLHLHK